MNHTDMMAKLSRRPAVSGNQLWVEFFDRLELGQSRRWPEALDRAATRR